MVSPDKNRAKRSSGKRPKKRKFTGNMYTRCSKPEASNSASAKKVNLRSELLQDIDPSFKGYRIVDINLILSLMEEHLSCKVCGGDVVLTEDIVCGLSSKISIKCRKCCKLAACRNSKMLGAKKNIPEINLRFTYAFRVNGLGLAGMKLFCGIMDLPQPIAVKNYNNAVKKILAASNTVAMNSVKQAVAEEVELTGSSDIIISGDGTWKTRGHTSRVGVCTIIGDKSGKVIDTEVLSTFCKSCDTWKSLKGTDMYKDWKKAHENECLINHHGSAGKMEVVGMTRIFERSILKHGTRYLGYIGDGDTKTYPAITELAPYGSNKIEKIECVGHVQKRMGTRLRKLKKSGVKCSDNKSVGGKGRLTDQTIDKICSYYGNAIREHKNSLMEMRKAVWAVYFHIRSSDKEPLHSFCPTGPSSWCKFQRSVFEGSVKTFKHKEPLPAAVMDTIKPVFKDLSDPKLLRRCLGGKTQNANESLNALIWKMCPKTQGSGKRIVEIATNEAVLLFNDGNIGRIAMLTTLGFTVGRHSESCFVDLDRQRVATAELRFQESSKEARKTKKMRLSALHESFVQKEGITYASGAF